MSADDIQTSRNTRSFETALKQLLHTAQTTKCDPQGSYTVPAPDEDHPAYTVKITVAATADERIEQCQYSYCLDCDWTVSTTEYPRSDVSRRVVDHATATGHDIESTDQPIPMETGGTDHPDSCDTSSAVPGTERPASTEDGREVM
jgi:hypothetical protein